MRRPREQILVPNCSLLRLISRSDSHLSRNVPGCERDPTAHGIRNFLGLPGRNRKASDHSVFRSRVKRLKESDMSETDAPIRAPRL